MIRCNGCMLPIEQCKCEKEAKPENKMITGKNTGKNSDKNTVTK